MPAAPLSLAACAIEAPVNAWWPPGYALGANKFTTSVFHGGMQICLEGHDCGNFIPHLQIAPAPNNLLTLLHIPLSSRKANFSASTVLMDGAPTGCMTMIAWPPTPMTYCSEPIRMPLADAPTSHLNSVEVGMTWGDWLAGAIGIAAGMLLDYVLFRRAGGTRGFGQSAGKYIAKSKAGQSTSQLLSSSLIGSLKPSFGMNWALKQGVNNLVGAAKIGLTGRGSLGISQSIGGPFLGLTGSATATHGEDGWSGKGGVSGKAGTASGNLDTSGAGMTSRHPLGFGQDGVSHDWDGGTSSSDVDVDPFGGFDNQATTVGPDGTVTVSRSDGPSGLPNQL